MVLYTNLIIKQDVDLGYSDEQLNVLRSLKGLEDGEKLKTETEEISVPAVVDFKGGVVFYEKDNNTVVKFIRPEEDLKLDIPLSNIKEMYESKEPEQHEETFDLNETIDTDEVEFNSLEEVEAYEEELILQLREEFKKVKESFSK